MYRILLIHLPFSGHFGCFHLLGSVNNAVYVAVYISVLKLIFIPFSNPPLLCFSLLLVVIFSSWTIYFNLNFLPFFILKIQLFF